MKFINIFTLNLIFILSIHASPLSIEALDKAELEASKKSVQLLEQLSKNPPSETHLYEMDAINELKTTSTVKIMPLGDSITYDNCSLDVDPNPPRPIGVRHAYRNHLWYKLKDANYPVNFVGSQQAGGDIVPHFDIDNEGWPGINSYNLSIHTYSLLQQNTPDIILLHIGTNDHSTSVSSLNHLLDEVDRFESHYDHHIKVLLAKIIDSTDAQRHTWVTGFNDNLINLAQSREAQGDDIIVVDMYRGACINYNRDMEDFLHPNDRGYEKMAKAWYNALIHILPGGTPETPTEPSNLQREFLSDSSVELTWTDRSNNETGFKIYENNSYLATVSANHTSYVLTGLSINTDYTYKVVAYNDDGSSDTISISFTIPTPNEPTEIQASSIKSYTALLTWTDNSNIETGFKIYQDNTLIATVCANVTSYALSDLWSNTSYTYKIVAYNAAGDSDPITISFTTEDDYGWLPAVYHTVLY